MADNIAITAGSGTTLGTDERSIGGSNVHLERVLDEGGSSIAAAQTEISNTSAAIVAARETRKHVVIVNRQTVAVFIGASAATTSMFRLDPGDSISIETTAAVYGITSAAYTATGDAKVHYIETYS